MKRKIMLYLIAAFCISGRPVAVSQCNPTELTSTCPENIPNGFAFVKSYDLNAAANANKRIEKSYVFSKDMTYSVAFCEEVPNVVVKIFDSNRKEVASNFYQDKYLPAIGFQCGATGIYYMAFSFEKANKDCGAAVLAFKK